MRAKVYEIINLSGLDPSDPMFLILALTGQMRVFLEAAPAELGELLSEWKSESASSLSEIMSAISRVKETQQEQAEAIKGDLESVSQKCVSDIKEAGMVTTSAIAEANNETLAQAQQAKAEAEELKREFMALRASEIADRQRNEEVTKALLGQVEQVTRRQELTNTQINNSASNLERIQKKAFWLKWADWFSPLSALVVVQLTGIGVTWWLASARYNQPNNILGRRLVDWNIQRIRHCQETENPKCTVWIVHPDSPKRKE